MKKIILMFVVLITSIANAQTFDFECEGLTPAELAALRTERLDEIETFEDNSTVEIAHASSATKGDAFRIYVGTTSNEHLYTIDYGVNGSLIENLTIPEYADYKAAVIAEIINQDPNYVATMSFQEELTALYDATTPPTGFVSGGTIETEALTHNNALGSVVQVFMKKLSSENNQVFSLSAPTPAHVTIITAIGTHDNVPSPYDNITIGNHTGAQIRDWALDVVQAIWLLEHPNYVDTTTVEYQIEAIYAAIDPPTAFNDIINNAAGDAYGDSNEVRRAFASKFDNYNLTFDTFNQIDGKQYAVYTNNDIPNIVLPGDGSTFNEGNFKLWMLEIAKAVWHKGHPEWIDYSAIRTDRIAQITALVDASANAEMSIVPVENFGEAFRISGSNIQTTDFATGIFETGVTSFGRLSDTVWAEMKQRITAKINEIDNAADLTALRTTRINELDALDITGVSIAHSTQSNGNDSFSVTKPGDQIVINADWYGPGLVEYHTDEDFADLKDAVIAAREELNPANAIYGFTPAQFQIASLQDKVDKAWTIAKANDDIQAVAGSLYKLGGTEIGVEISARNYPLTLRVVMAPDSDYEGWKTLINRILYLVKTGDGSERTTRENHINGIAGNISVKDLDGGDDDWAVAWNDLPFIYGGSDENDHDASYDSHGNTSRVFAGYHQDNIGLLPGIIYEALLVEVHRINGYVIAADALRRHADGGYNKEREVGLKALTGDAAFHEDYAQEWFVLNSDVTVWTSSKYGPLCNVEAYLWLGVMDNYSFRYMYIIIRNELLRNADGTRYYNNVNQNIYCL